MQIVNKNLILLGMMGVGKTTIGKIVAKTQGLEFIDTDAYIEKKNLMKIKEIFKKKGENYFRNEEKKYTLKLIKKNNCVIALGGGAFINKSIRKSILKNCISIWLDANTNILSKRVKWNQKRPLLNDKNVVTKINKLYAERKNVYKLSDHKIICDQLNKKEIVKKINSFYDKKKNNS